jgi:uncharacterized protein YhfF
MDGGTETEHDDRVAAFWEVARFHARLNAIPSYFGPSALESVPPPAWSFADSRDEADRRLAGLLDGTGTTTESPLADFEEGSVPVPEVGTLGIVLDGAGDPRALVVTTAVRIEDGVVTEELQVLHRA